MKKRVVSIIVLGLIAYSAVSYAKTLPRETVEEGYITIVSTEEKHFDFEKTEYEWGILFKDKDTGNEYKFIYDEPLQYDEPEFHITDPENPYYIIEQDLEQDVEKRSTREICEEIALLYDLEPEWLMAMCVKESQCDPEAFNGVDRGIIQVCEKWHKARMKRLGVTNLNDPYQCVLVAADFLAELIEYSLNREDVNGDMQYVFMRYNMATDAVEEFYEQGIISEYAQDIIRMSDELKEELRRG